jgi:hypothetical protein
MSINTAVATGIGPSFSDNAIEWIRGPAQSESTVDQWVHWIRSSLAPAWRRLGQLEQSVHVNDRRID